MGVGRVFPPLPGALPRRRLLLAAGLWPLALPPFNARAAFDYPPVQPRPLAFPRDHGAHPDYRIEWWYLTGQLDVAPQPIGIQVTFFRARPPLAADNPSRFAAQQLIIAHAAIADPARGSLLKDERIARAGFGLAQAAEGDTDVQLDRWRLRREADGSYRCELPAQGFMLRFTALPTQPLLLQGAAGFSQKGPHPGQASFYYSQPQLQLQAELERDGRRLHAAGRAWLDHEWSTSVLDADGVGWDWAGLNLDDGAALTAFRIRRKDGSAPVHAYASLRAAGQAQPALFGPDQVRFEPLEYWESPRTRARWPVAQRIRVGRRVFDTQPLMPDQELDSRASAGAIYWEGASRVLEDGRPAGAGYLELTGYAAPIVL